MKALLLDDTHPFLEQELQQGGLLLVREFQARWKKSRESC